MNNKIINWLLLNFLTVLLMACSASPDSVLTAYINRVKSQAMQQPKPIPPLEKQVKFLYSEKKNRSTPFHSRLSIKVDSEKVDKNREEFPLESLKYVGVLQRESETWALISRSDGKIFPIKVGDSFGENEGKLIAIKENLLRVEKRNFVAGKLEVEVKEFYLNSNERTEGS